ncbi:MAG: hypothetical protein ACJAQ1_001149, partial [Flavobacterium sp.]
RLEISSILAVAFSINVFPAIRAARQLDSIGANF